MIAPMAVSATPPTPAQLVANFGFAPGQVGFLLVDLPSGKVLEAMAPDQPFLPASTAKLATAYAAERNLGPDYRFSTSLLRRGLDVYLQGGGDPVLTANDLQALAQQLRAADVNGTGGHFFYYERQLPALPEVSDGQPIATPYNAGFGALNVDFNRVDVTWSTVGGERIFQVRPIADRL